MRKLLLILPLVIWLGCVFAKDLPSMAEIEKMSEQEKYLLYDKYKIKPFNNILISYFVPTLGHRRINQGEKSIKIYKYGLGISFIIFGFLEMSGQGSEAPHGGYFSLVPEEFNFVTCFYLIHFWQVYDAGKQTKIYNNNIYRKILGNEPPPLSFNLQPTYKGANLTMSYSFN